MSEAISGTVVEVSEKPWEGKHGPITLYSFKVNSSSQWFRTGTKKPPIEQGQSIEFVAEGQNADINTIKVSDKPAAAQAPARKQATSGGSRDDYWSNKEDFDKNVRDPRISFAASRNSAVQVVCAALSGDVLSFGSVSKGAKLDMFLDYVDQVTDRFFLQSVHAHEHLVELEKGQTTDAVEKSDEEEGYDYGE